MCNTHVKIYFDKVTHKYILKKDKQCHIKMNIW